MDRNRRTALGRLAAMSAAAAGVTGVGSAVGSAHAQAVTSVRIGIASAPVGSPPVFADNSVAIAHNRGWLEEEFKRSGIKVEWFFFRGAGPAVNEALANGQLDFAQQGDLPAVVARATGLKTQLLLAAGQRKNLYLAVAPSAPISSVTDLRGKRVALFKGTSGQLPTDRLLAKHGLSERDLKAYNLDYAAMQAALATGDIDAAFGGIELLKLRDKGVARIVYRSKGDSPLFTRQSHLLVLESFEKSHPEIVQRVVDVVVKAARWGSDDANREEVLRDWAKAGTPYEHWKEDYENESLSIRLAPNFDPFLVSLYKSAARSLVEYKLTRREAQVDGWVNRRYLDRALREQKLENYWARLDENGHEIAVPGAKGKAA
ncbi:MAG: Nitrate transporter substrate-binding protein [Betaproteobacteria bacterium]|jgi:sulfonate transport system substrate-binding protein|nr:Nitrate transporter substrate-binding protein [Betaproteobacteria bacterium]